MFWVHEKVPLNVRIGGVEIPIGLTIVLLILLATALLNLMTKEVATIGGLIFTGIFLAIFMQPSEYIHEKRRGMHRATSISSSSTKKLPTKWRRACWA